MTAGMNLSPSKLSSALCTCASTHVYVISCTKSQGCRDTCLLHEGLTCPVTSGQEKQEVSSAGGQQPLPLTQKSLCPDSVSPSLNGSIDRWSVQRLSVRRGARLPGFKPTSFSSRVSVAPQQMGIMKVFMFGGLGGLMKVLYVYSTQWYMSPRTEREQRWLLPLPCQPDTSG